MKEKYCNTSLHIFMITDCFENRVYTHPVSAAIAMQFMKIMLRNGLDNSSRQPDVVYTCLLIVTVWVDIVYYGLRNIALLQIKSMHSLVRYMVRIYLFFFNFVMYIYSLLIYEQRRGKTVFAVSPLGPIQTTMHIHTKCREHSELEGTISVAKTMALINWAVTAQLTCAFVFTYMRKHVFSRRDPYYEKC